jgi:uncharacterized repeat protein (TIGR02543 family)
MKKNFFGKAVTSALFTVAALMIATIVFTGCEQPTDDDKKPAKVATPVADIQPAEGETSVRVAPGTQVTLSCETEGASIYYTLDGTDPTSASTEYTEGTPVTIPGESGVTTTLKAIGVKEGLTDSDILTVSYEVSDTVVAMPTASPSGGVVSAGTQVTLTCTTDEATIYYTIDGTTPTSIGTEYTAGTPITINVATTIKAFASKEGLTDSAVLTAVYTISGTGSNDITYTVTFNSNGGSAVDAQIVTEGGLVTAPANPTRHDYSFGGWYKETALTTIWDFATDTVTGDITLYVKWTAAVTFDADGGTPAPEAQTVAEGDKVTEPPAMTKADYVFGGWYKEAARTTPWNFTMDTVAGDITLYAKWDSLPTVTFNADGGSPAPTAQTVASGGKVTEPPAITKADHVFGGWYQEAALTTPWDFVTDTVTGDITLYAKWILFKMVTVGALNTSFPKGSNDTLAAATVADPYEIGETEVTYELWYAVRSWAESNGYTFSNPGQEGSAGTNGAAPTEAKQEPVTMVTWFDAVVWLNALTEWMNAKTGTTLTLVYYYDSGYNTVAKNSDPASNFEKEAPSHTIVSAHGKPGTTGFRLLTNNEFELAAKWRGSDTTNTVTSGGYTNPYLTKGNSASGATASTTDATATGAVAWYKNNASKTQAVKGKAANTLGLYDMSGNVFEWCDDWYSTAATGIYRIYRGGSWNADAVNLRVCNAYTIEPDTSRNDTGFRPARTQ